MNTLALKQLPMLIKREYWEHRTTFLYLPAVVTAVSVAVLILGSALMQTGMVMVTINNHENVRIHTETESSGSLLDLFGARLVGLADSSFGHRERVLTDLYCGSSTILVSTLWFVMFFYLLDCLYQDRKDRSVLFWKSLPISDWMTVVSKLLTGLLVIPVVYLLFIVLSNVSMLLISSMVALGQPIDIWDTLWAPAHLIPRWIDMIGYILFSSIWCLPFTGWLLLVSSWAKSAPLAWVVGVPFFFLLMEKIFSRDDSLWEFMSTHILARYTTDHGITGDLYSLEVVVALVIGVGFVTAAVWRRGHADEI